MPLENALVMPCLCYRCSFCNKSFLLMDDGEKHEETCSMRFLHSAEFVTNIDNERKAIHKKIFDNMVYFGR